LVVVCSSVGRLRGGDESIERLVSRWSSGLAEISTFSTEALYVSAGSYALKSLSRQEFLSIVSAEIRKLDGKEQRYSAIVKQVFKEPAIGDQYISSVRFSLMGDKQCEQGLRSRIFDGQNELYVIPGEQVTVAREGGTGYGGVELQDFMYESALLQLNEKGSLSSDSIALKPFIGELGCEGLGDPTRTHLVAVEDQNSMLRECYVRKEGSEEVVLQLGALQVSASCVLPEITIRALFVNDSLKMFRSFQVRNVRLNELLPPGEFIVSAKKGCLLVDIRGGDRVVYALERDIDDVVGFLDSKASRSGADKTASGGRSWILIAYVTVTIVLVFVYFLMKPYFEQRRKSDA